MKYCFILLFQLIVFSACGQNKENEVTSLESEMMSFFSRNVGKELWSKRCSRLISKGFGEVSFQLFIRR